MKTISIFPTLLLCLVLGAEAQEQWIKTSTPAMSFYSIYFINATTGWAVGYPDAIYKTTNGGSTWGGSQSTGTNNQWRYIYFIDANTGWIVGSSGRIHKTTNGGSNWTAQTSGTTTLLYSVFFLNADTGWVVGDSGVIRKTTNGGTTWVTQVSGTTDDLYSVYFVNSTAGWVVSGFGDIFKYSTSTPILSSHQASKNFDVEGNKSIRYRLDHRSHVIAKIFDMRGKLILKLLDGDQKSGPHFLPLPTLPSSDAYILDFTAGDFHKTVKLQ